jgi:acyl carrier protein
MQKRLSQEEVRALVAATTGIATDSDMEADLYLELAVASFAALQLLLDLEEQLGVQIPDEEFVQASSIAKLTAMLNDLPASALAAANAL